MSITKMREKTNVLFSPLLLLEQYPIYNNQKSFLNAISDLSIICTQHCYMLSNLLDVMMPIIFCDFPSFYYNNIKQSPSSMILLIFLAFLNLWLHSQREFSVSSVQFCCRLHLPFTSHHPVIHHYSNRKKPPVCHQLLVCLLTVALCCCPSLLSCCFLYHFSLISIPP